MALALALLMSWVCAADDVQITAVPLAGFPSYNLAMLASLLDGAVYFHSPYVLLRQHRR